jgi:hypothetical protein
MHHRKNKFRRTSENSLARWKEEKFSLSMLRVPYVYNYSFKLQASPGLTDSTCCEAMTPCEWLLGRAAAELGQQQSLGSEWSICANEKPHQTGSCICALDQSIEEYLIVLSG